MPKIARVLTGCTSMETAHVQPDYPFGFRLRCQRRCWLEHKPGHGFRMMTQTSNPKKPGVVWNKPKASTYLDFALLVLTDEYLDSEGKPAHVTWVGATVNANADAVEALMAAFWEQMDETQQETVKFVHRMTLVVGSKPTGRLYRVTDHLTGEDLGTHGATWTGFAAMNVVQVQGTAGMPLSYLNDTYFQVSVYESMVLGRTIRVETIPAVEQAAA